MNNPQTQPNGAPAPGRALAPVEEVRGTLDRMKDQFRAALPPQIPVDRFVRVVMTAVQRNPDLLEHRPSLYAAAMLAAQDGLLPDGREAVIIAYNANVGTKQMPKWERRAQYQPMAEGLLKKVRNSGELANISVQIVKQNDRFLRAFGDDERIEHEPAPLGQDRGQTIGAYSIATLMNGMRSREVMDLTQIEAVRARSKSADRGPWVTDYDEMCRKTVFRRHYKRLPKSTELDGAIDHDDESFDLELAASRTPPTPATEAGQASPGNQRPKALQQALEHKPAMSSAQAKPKQAEPVPVDAVPVEAGGDPEYGPYDDLI